MKPIRTAALILTVLTLAVILTIGRAIAEDIRVATPQHCLYAADMALVASSFAPHVASIDALRAGIAPAYLDIEVSPIVAQRIISRAWEGLRLTPTRIPREWATAMRDACAAGSGDLNQFLREPT
jgi:hypothetical protein